VVSGFWLPKSEPEKLDPKLDCHLKVGGGGTPKGLLGLAPAPEELDSPPAGKRTLPEAFGLLETGPKGDVVVVKWGNNPTPLVSGALVSLASSRRGVMANPLDPVEDGVDADGSGES
jgi:hypothetical protein